MPCAKRYWTCRYGTSIAKIVVIGGRNFGDVPVEVTPTGLSLKDPDGLTIDLRYDPKDIQFPFKGADSQGKTYELTPK